MREKTKFQLPLYHWSLPSLTVLNLLCRTSRHPKCVLFFPVVVLLFFWIALRGLIPQLLAAIEHSCRVWPCAFWSWARTCLLNWGELPSIYRGSSTSRLSWCRSKESLCAVCSYASHWLLLRSTHGSGEHASWKIMIHFQPGSSWRFHRLSELGCSPQMDSWPFW